MSALDWLFARFGPTRAAPDLPPPAHFPAAPATGAPELRLLEDTTRAVRARQQHLRTRLLDLEMDVQARRRETRP